MQTIILTKGIPASGKTTWAKSQVKKDPLNICRINRDDLREMTSNYTFSIEGESLVQSIVTYMINASLKRGMNVILDETNLKKGSFKRVESLVNNLNIDCKIIEKPFYISFNDAIKRNSERSRTVPSDVMKKMWEMSGKEGFSKYIGREKVILKKDNIDYLELSEKLNNDKLPRCILVDLDGTISLFNRPGELTHSFAHERNPYDASNCDNDSPNETVVETVHMYYDAGYKVIFCSGREDKYRAQTISFLKNNLRKDLQYDLYMRKSGDYRKDFIIKESLLREHVVDKYRVFLSLDDRDMMINYYRNVLKIPVWQVNDGSF